jgi:PAS domain S-box-containing protein
MVSLADQVHVSRISDSQTRVSLTFFLGPRSQPDREGLSDPPDAALRQLEAETMKLELMTTRAQALDEERALTHEEMRQRVEELEKVMDIVPVAIWVAHDPECLDITGNQTANEFYEALPDENVSAGPAPGEQDTTRRFFQDGCELKPEELPMQEAAARGADIRNSELEVLRPSGALMTMLGNASPLRDAQGQVRGCVGAFVDITERKRAEEELREAQTQAEADLEAMTRLQQLAALSLEESSLGTILLEIVDAAIAISGSDFGNIQLVSDTTGDLEIVAHRGFPGWWLDFWSGVSKGTGCCGTALQRGERVIIEDVERSPIFVGTPGLRVQLEAGVHAVQSTPLISRTGKPLGMFSTHFRTPHRPDARELRLLDLLARQAADMIGQEQSREMLRESEERFRTMADAIPQLAWIAGSDGYIYWYNERWYEYTGTTPAEMEGWGWQSVHDPEVLPTVLARWRESIASGEPFDMEFPLRGADGVFRAFLTRVMPLKDGDGRVLQWFGTNTDVSERKRAEEAAEEQRRLLLTAEKDYRVLFSEMLDGLGVHEIILDDGGQPCDYRFLAVNPAFERLTGLRATDVVGKTVLEVIPDLEPSWIESYGRVALTGEEAHFDSYSAGPRRHYEVTAYRPEAGRFATIFHDVTERKRAEKTLLRFNRTLAAHSASDQALIRATDESSYLEEVCRIVVEDCGHAMVWIGYKEDDENKSVRPVASAGFEEGYLDTLNITWANRERGRGPTGAAVRTGRPSICRNMLTDPVFAPWRDEAVRRGYASSIAVPLLEGETAFGAITIYSSDPDPFSDEEVKLLADLTDDLALGITTLRLRTAHAEAEREREILLTEEQKLTEELQAMNEELQSRTKELAAREVELQVQNEELRASRYNRTLIEASLDPLVTIGLDGTITDVNEATVKISGYSRDELVGTDFADYFTAPESARSGYREVFTNGSVTDYPLTIRARDGRLTNVLYNATLYRDEEGKVLGVFAAARDMTAIKELEEQRAIASALQKALLDLPQRAPGVEFGHLYRSATQQAQVGGDFYDVFEANGGRIGLLIGDVSGHGVEAARTATLVKDVVHAFAHQFRRPYLVLRETNRLLVEKNLSGFVTVFLGLLDPETGTLVYSSAGHPPPLLLAERQAEPLTSASLPLGVFADARYRDVEIDIPKGALLLLYTDGLTEARRNGNFFGEAGLAATLAKLGSQPIEELPSALLNEVLSFSDGRLRDDVALLAVSYLGVTAKEGS